VPPASGYPAIASAYGTTGSGRDVVINALLLVPSVIVFAVSFGFPQYLSPLTPWTVLTALYAFFVICVAARARTNDRRGIAALLAIAAVVIHGFATSASPTWGLGALLRHMLPRAMHHEVLPWAGRLTFAATIVLLVAAWGVARRSRGGLGIGLVLSGVLIIAWRWYFETNLAREATWFDVWLLNVGGLVAGCLVCWAVEVVSTSARTQPPVR
jgi:hypothetical protein